MNQIYFTADLHFGHSNILKHSPKRPYSDMVDIAAHDEWLLDLWRSTVDKRDTIYILGDLTFLKSENARHLLERLPFLYSKSLSFIFFLNASSNFLI